LYFSASPIQPFMKNKSANNLLLYGFLFISICAVNACSTTRVYKTTITDDNSYHSPYDDTTLTVDNNTVLMPYNRIIDPAGTVIRFGDPKMENHSLDCALLPGQKTLVVEDRYGITFFNVQNNQLLFHLDYTDNTAYRGFMSTYSGIKVWTQNDSVHISWGAAHPSNKQSYILDAIWNGEKAFFNSAIAFDPLPPSPLALPNDNAVATENGETYMYVVLNGNSQLSKIRLRDKQVIWSVPTGMAPFGLTLTTNKIYVTNWAGPVPDDTTRETAGIPYGNVYIDPRTGATAMGSVSILDRQTGKKIKEIEVGLHPNAIITSPDGQYIYVSNGNSDHISVISTKNDQVIDSISVRLNNIAGAFGGDSPNALTIDSAGTTL